MASRERARIIVCGYVGLFPAGGVAWDYLQYVLGFASLGHDVYYIEDTGNWPTYVPAGDAGDGRYNIRFLSDAMAGLGLADRWAYRDPVSERWYGLDEGRVREIYASADIFVSISCSALPSEAWESIPVRIVIDSDPMFTQIQLARGTGFTRNAAGLAETLGRFTHHFTFGENIGASDCLIPETGIDWTPTRQPVALDLWECGPPKANMAFTTVMNWTALTPIEFAGEQWGQKDAEFAKIESIPCAFPEQDFSVVVNGQEAETFPRAALEQAAWSLLQPAQTLPDWRSYRAFIQQSAGEISIAKHAYVAARTGWFSCRTACYLAAGRPALVQQTGWSCAIPEGAGLQGFGGAEEACEKMRMILDDLPAHAKGARAIAEEFFDARRVLAAMLDACKVAA